MWFLLCLIPYVPEVTLEAWAEKKKGISVGHAWTAIARGALMVGVGYALWRLGVTAFWWQGTILSLGIFIALFNYTYNLLTGRPFFYLREKGIDKYYASVPPFGRLFWEVLVLATSIYIYAKPYAIFGIY